jgi:hypothetical protein
VPHPSEYELMLFYKGKDISVNDLKTLNDYEYEEGGKIMVSKQTFYDFMNDDVDMNSGIIDDKDYEANTQTLMSFGLD